jgi:hypothetical protein
LTKSVVAGFFEKYFWRKSFGDGGAIGLGEVFFWLGRVVEKLGRDRR